LRYTPSNSEWKNEYTNYKLAYSQFPARRSIGLRRAGGGYSLVPIANGMICY